MAESSLLPPNRNPLEAALEQVTANDLDPSAIAALWDPETCPAEFLPWLAWAYSVDDWGADWSEDAQRRVIAESLLIHKHKGTPSAIRRVMEAVGYGDVEIVEGISPNTYNGARTHNGAITHGDTFGWAYYIVKVKRLMTSAQGEVIRAMLANVAPARCHLYALDFSAAALTYNAMATYNGTYDHGAT
jgi:phage tail P2-like protein